MDKLEDLEGGLPEGPSKSRVKREHLALQDLAERLVALPRAELERLHLGEATWIAIDETPRIKDQRARPRHFKRLANLLAREDIETVQALLERKAGGEHAAAARHRRVERWRERLIAEGDAALTELLDLCPDADRQQLRQLVRAAQGDRDKGRPEAARRLFRFLRAALDEAGAA